jgi:glycosyltransferase involved in cell wall biosynthesis
MEEAYGCKRFHNVTEDVDLSLTNLLKLLPLQSNSSWPWAEETDPAVYADRADWPRISIVTPSYNQGQFLEETIRSVLLQNYPNLQYIVMDGGSTDGSVEIIKKYEPWIDFWLSEKDRGQSHAINKGLERCNGVWFNWINSDDCLLPGALAAIGRADLQAALVSGAELTGPNLQETRPLGRTKLGPTLEEAIVNQYICQQGVFFRTEEVKKAGGVREELHYVMDLDLIIRLLLRHGREATREIPETLAFFRQHGEAKTATVAEKFLEEERRLFRGLAEAVGCRQELRERLGKPSGKKISFPETKRLARARLEELMAIRFWWGEGVEKAWNQRKFNLFKKEVKGFRKNYPEIRTGRIRRLGPLARLPESWLSLISKFRAGR